MGFDNIVSVLGLIVKFWPVIKAALALVGKYQEEGHDDPVGAAHKDLRMLHGMSMQDEQAWFDRASRSDNGGA